MNHQIEAAVCLSLAGLCTFAVGAVLNGCADTDDRETVEVEITVQ